MLKRISLLALCLLTVSCIPSPEELVSKQTLFKKRSKVTTVSTLTVAGHEIPLVVREKGKTEASDKFMLNPPEGVTKASQIFADLGQRVEAGDPLVRFSDEALKLKLDLARSQVSEAEAGLKDLEFEGRRPPPKPSEGEAESAGELPPIEGGVDEKRVLYNATIERAKNEIELYEKQLENIQILSPIAGLVTKRNITEGSDLVKGDEPLLEVVRISPLRFTFEVPLEVAATLSRGQIISVRFPDLKSGDVSGEITLIGAESGQEGKVQVKLSLANEAYSLKAGMEGEVTLRTTQQKTVWSIPSSALLKTDRSTYVFKVNQDRIRKTPVTVSEEENGGMIVIRGLADGDLIVASNIERLKDGARVEIQKNP